MRRARRSSAVVLAIAIGFVATAAFAQPAPSKPAQAAPVKAPPPAAPPPAKTSAIVHLAGEIAQALGQVPPGALVVVSPLASDVASTKGDELAVKVGAQIAGRIGTARAHAQPATISVARGLSGRAASLLYVQVEIAKGELRATADLYPIVSNGWERLRNPAPGPRAHAFAGAPLDAEIRSYLAPILLEQAQVHKAKHDEGDVLAVGCGDIDSDGGVELVLVSRARVTIGKLRGGKLTTTRSAPWASIATQVPVPLREPIATVVASPLYHRGEIFVGISDRTGAALDGSLVTRRQLSGLPIAGGDGDACALPIPDQSLFDANVISCAAPLPDPKRKDVASASEAFVFQSPTPRFDTIAALDLIGKDGAVSRVVAAREPSGKLKLRRFEDGRPIEATIDNAGAQLALADLDLDGVPEIATSADSGDDAIVVQSWNGKGLSPRLKLPAKDGVRALAACPPEERGVPALVAVVGQEVWLVR